ncbi:protein associated with UVRAG as autophagy enhancer [Betta splendens]|uniref:Protein associated with UVRAG as autophagy enhancer n=1 Tax=Betta splendens TaxID=158456 RepID=A0A6P7LB12_BETSP|nr:protein associated with UVRAG as autophagy enhancer [Betta splendens]
MGSCRDLHSALCRSRFISWCVESPVDNSQAAPETCPRGFPQPPGSSSVPLLLLSPPETNPQRVQSQKTHLKACPRSSSALLHTEPAAGPSDDRREDCGGCSCEDPSSLLPGQKNLHLPRSSPVMSRRPRPVSWHGAGTDAAKPASLDLSAARASPSQDLHGSLTAGSLEELGPGPSPCLRSPPTPADKKPRALSSNLNDLLNSLLHLPFSGLQARTQEHRGRGPCSREGCRSADVSAHSSADVFRTSWELDEENAHFIVVDMVLEVLEGVKWSLTPSTDHVLQQLPQRCTASASTRPHAEPEGGGEAERPLKTCSVLSTDSGFEDCAGDALTQKAAVTDAESLAQQLVEQFRRSWLPSRGPRRARLSLRSSLQELPGSDSAALSSGSLKEEIRLRTRMRGSLNWAPPRFQIIFTVPPALRRSDAVALQNFLCAGCGTRLEPKHIKKLQYCEYLGRYFCDCCHSGAEALIPARVLSSWDFGRYPVSDFSRQLLDSVWYQPLFDLTCVGKTLRVKELDKFRELQDQLLCIRKLLKACRLSDSVQRQCEQLPAHLMERPHLFSMDDLLRVKRGQLVAQARAVLHAAISHVESCKLCLARGFICEFCRDRDVIFAFQMDVCRRCPACKTCFHKECFAGNTCPKCARIQSRKKCPDESRK